LWVLAAIARLSRKRAAAFIIPSLFFYAAVTGLHIPALRAAVMASILVGSYFFERRVFLPNSLAAAAFFILCLEYERTVFHWVPAFLRCSWRNCAVGRSVLQAFSGTAAPDPFSAAKPSARPRRGCTPPMNGFAVAHSVSLAAWIGSLPLILWYCPLVRRFSLLANCCCSDRILCPAVALTALMTRTLLPWSLLLFITLTEHWPTMSIGIVHHLRGIRADTPKESTATNQSTPQARQMRHRKAIHRWRASIGVDRALGFAAERIRSRSPLEMPEERIGQQHNCANYSEGKLVPSGKQFVRIPAEYEESRCRETCLGEILVVRRSNCRQVLKPLQRRVMPDVQPCYRRIKKQRRMMNAAARLRDRRAIAASTHKKRRHNSHNAIQRRRKGESCRCAETTLQCPPEFRAGCQARIPLMKLFTSGASSKPRHNAACIHVREACAARRTGLPPPWRISVPSSA